MATTRLVMMLGRISTMRPAWSPYVQTSIAGVPPQTDTLEAVWEHRYGGTDANGPGG